MCVIFWSVDQPGFDLVVASNRDEYLARETLPAVWHRFGSTSSSATDPTSSAPSEERPVLSARDSSGGGTWLGITRNGCFSTLTNFTEAPPTLPAGLDAFRSRGELVRNWLLQASMPEHADSSRGGPGADRIRTYLERIGSTLDQYPGFNLLVGTREPKGVTLGYTTNRTHEGRVLVQREPDVFAAANDSHVLGKEQETAEQRLKCLAPTRAPGEGATTIEGMSNSVLRDVWSKVDEGKELFRAAVARRAEAVEPEDEKDCLQADEQLIEELFDLLWKCSDPPPKDKPELRKSVFIPPLYDPGPGWYATRTSTVVLVRKPASSDHPGGTATFVERDVFALLDGKPVRKCGGPAGRSCSQRRYDWMLDPDAQHTT
ncbi:hypothetical protein ACQY0O_002541 [Thecaphora frezii]